MLHRRIVFYLFTVLLLLPNFGAEVWAKPLETYLKDRTSFLLSNAVKSLAFSADEALIAVAMDKGPSGAVVQIHDRASTKPLSRLKTNIPKVTRMRFNVQKNQLAISGNSRIEIWDLKSVSNGSQPILTKEQRLWEYDAEEISQLQFNKTHSNFIWSEGSQVKSLAANAPDTPETLWEGRQQNKIRSFALDQQETQIAVSDISENNIHLTDLDTNENLPALDYHSFPVVGLHFEDAKTLLSLDQERNFVRGSIQQRIKQQGGILKALSKQETPVQLQALRSDRLMVVSHSNTSKRYHASILSPERNSLARLAVHNPEAIAFSPTNAYLAVANTPLSVSIHKTSNPLSPEEYIQELRVLGAEETARRYRNHLDEIPEQLPSGPPPLPKIDSTLKLLEGSMKVAEKTQQWSEVGRIADQILPLDSKNPAALAAKKNLANLKDEDRIKLGKRHINAGEYEQSVRVLRKIKASSPHHETARRLIVHAEQQIEISLKLRNAEEQIRRKNPKGAEALLELVLKLDPKNKKALEMQAQLQSNRQWSIARNVLMLLLALSALGAGGYLILKRKRNKALDSEPLEQVYSGTQQHESSTQSSKKKQSKAHKKPGYRDSHTIAQAYFLDNLNKTKETLRVAQRKDIEGRHATRLMSFEVEINLIAKKAEDPTANLKELSSQLLVMLQTMRGLNFKVHPRSKHRASTSGTPKKPEKSESPSEDYYSLLGISADSSAKKIKKAYHEKLKEYHPDRHQNSEFEWVQEQAEAMTRSLHDAYEILADKESRQRYDQKLKK